MVHRTAFVDIYGKWLFFLSILFLFAPNNTPIINKIIFVLVFLMLFFPIFIVKDRFISNVSFNIPTVLSNSKLYLIIILQFFAGEYASRYYTGIGLFEALVQTLEGINNYAAYQNYFSENSIEVFTISKLPAILASAFVKGVFLYSISVFMLYKNQKGRKYFLLLSIIPLVLYSIARGTFFEIFEIVICILYFYKVTSTKIVSVLKLKSLKNNIYLISTAIVLTFIFSLNAAKRYESKSLLINSECLIEGMCFEPYSNFISIEFPIHLLSGYFSVGMYFVTEYITILFDGNLLPSIIPLVTTKFFNFTKLDLVSDLCTSYVPCGVSWQPDLFGWFSSFGLILTLLIFPLFFYLVFKIEKLLLHNLNLYSLPLLYLLFIYVISLPVGNFYTTSSANILCTFYFLVLWVIKKGYKSKSN